MLHEGERTKIAVVRTGRDLQAALGDRSDKCVGLVPTMGALHEGHLSLVRAARRDCDVVIASLFVNPTQFGEGEDFSSYPRDEARDVSLFAANGVDIVYAPPVDVMYPEGARATILASELAEGLCGDSRPGHFDGVVTAVSALLTHCAPHRAYFGEKDYQQLKVIERMVEDHGFAVKIVGCPIIREPDGLAMSSRNAYLAPCQRRIAPGLFRVMRSMSWRLKLGMPTAKVCKWGHMRLLEAGFDRIDYLEIRNGRSLEVAAQYRPGLRLFVAVWLGRTRLIDNLSLD